MSEFTFKEIDTAGVDTLNALAEADKFNEWMYKTIAPHLVGNILEIGSGIGNLSEFFLKNNASIWLSDIRLNYCEYLTGKFAGRSGMKEVLQMNLVDDDFDSKFGNLFNSFDSIFALNVVEHIQNDDLAIQNCQKLLKPGGKLLILVPAYQWLYNKFDEELEHYRRYTKRSLNKLIGKYLKVAHAQYFNLAGIAGWFVSGSIMKKKIIPTSQVRLYNKLVPIFLFADKLTFNLIGLSVIVVGEKIT
jgi:2-polyprenyl-3-methyl-5-hydroxy-6-metoxy-1,4-benzoquinol methylase